jgi:hypothetical protein
MNNRAFLVAGISLLTLAGAANAADHTLTAIGAGGLTTSSQPYDNGTTNPGRSAEDVPGQGSPLSGEDTTTPATDTLNHGNLKSNPAAASGKTAPSSNSVH